MIQLQVKDLKYMINQQDQLMILPCSMMLIMLFEKMIENAKIRLTGKDLDNLPYNDKQWGHWLARNVINTKQKLGLGVKSRNVKSRQVKKTGKKN